MADPRASFRWAVPESFNFARDVIDRLALGNRPGLLFISAEGAKRWYSFAEIAEQSQRYAAALLDRGVERGGRVIVALPKIPQWIFTMLALDRLGAVSIPGPEQLRAKDWTFRANHAEAVAMIGDAANLTELQGARDAAATVRTGFVVRGAVDGWLDLDALAAGSKPFAGVETRADEWAYIVYTSGTTKDPKGVIHDHAYTYAKRMQAQFWLDCTPADLVWCTASTGWAKSLWNVLLGPWSHGSTIVLHEGAFDPPVRMDLLQSLDVTILCQAPTEYRLEAKLADLGSRWKLPKLRHCVSAGEPLNPEVIARWKDAFGLEILDGYGQTENTLLVANLYGDRVRPGSMGRPTPGHDVTVIDEDGRECKTDETGDIALRGTPPSLFKGYLKNPEETAKCYRNGFYLTGDRAYVDDDGYFWFVGRADDVISSGAYRIGPFEVESALLEHPAVAESAVVGSPDPDRGNIVKAFVVLRAGHDGNDALVRELQEHCKRVTAPYKYPREIEFVKELPKTRSGKIRRVELRQLELERKGATRASGYL
ncbi:MAG TPA: AMP-binding protein [Candidatus Baltobacteraceae bacterium]|nr:AMP-binding protein [Candidatus Baltobacteraceae bacterium]